MDRAVLAVFPEQPVGLMAFVSHLPLRWSRGSVNHAIRRLVRSGLLVRASRGVYALTDAGRAARAAFSAVPKAG